MIKTESFDPSLWFLAFAGDELAGFSLCRQSSIDPNAGYVATLGVRRPWRKQGLGEALLLHSFARLPGARLDARDARRRRLEPDRRHAPVRACRHARLPGHRLLRAAGADRMSRLRARCPDCRTLTAVAVGPEYQCHSCGREFLAGLVRVPRAWGDGGETMAAAAHLALPYPEAGVIEADTLAEQNLLLACELPDRPIVLGGCCCSHVGAIEALSAGEECLAVVWIDAHGDLNTPETSPSGNTWGMPLRMVIDDGAVLPRNVALVGARNLDPPEVEFIASSGVQTGEGAVERALEGADAVYVALDCDGFDPGRARRLHARAGRAPARRGRDAAPGARRPHPRRRPRVHRPPPRRRQRAEARPARDRARPVRNLPAPTQV